MSDLLRAVEKFIYQEADLLDDWRLPEWFQLLGPDAKYYVPAVGEAGGMEADPTTTLFLLADNRMRLEQRVVRLMKKTAFAEYPHSKTRHFITNIQIMAETEESVTATGNFIVYRTKDSLTQSFFGKQRHILLRAGDGFLIQEKRICLDLDSLSPQAKLSIIL
jgi:p-cumate 2,3-dioxygenase beta subunit